MRGCLVVAIVAALTVPARADRVSVFSPVRGKLTRLYAHLGAHVEKGDLLAMIAVPDFGTPTSDVAKAMAELIAAERDLARQRELLAICGPLRDLEAAEDAYLDANAELERARRKHAIGESFELRAPVAGEILRQNVTPGVEVTGQFVSSDPTELFVIGDPEPLWRPVDMPSYADSAVASKVRAIPHASTLRLVDSLELATLFALSLLGLAICARGSIDRAASIAVR